jgi:hypothetical protein
MGAVDSPRERYYTLMQPTGTAGIHLAAFDLAQVPPTKTIVPLPTTIAMGQFTKDGGLVGIDEDGEGVSSIKT